MDPGDTKLTQSNSLREEQSDEGEPGNSMPYAGNFLQPFWLRCPLCSNHEMDRILLDYGRHLLLPIGIVLWLVFLFAEASPG